MALPLQLVDNFLLPYNFGQALLLLFVLAILGTLSLRSRKTLAATLVLFGLVFAMTPSSQAPVHFRFLGIALLVFGPVVYVTGNR
ncbi:MAG: hypothetical protein ABEJ70_07865 [Halobacteriaceae archaeon]